jgi:hypothetical protein
VTAKTGCKLLAPTVDLHLGTEDIRVADAATYDTLSELVPIFVVGGIQGQSNNAVMRQAWKHLAIR